MNDSTKPPNDDDDAILLFEQIHCLELLENWERSGEHAAMNLPVRL